MQKKPTLNSKLADVFHRILNSSTLTEKTNAFFFKQMRMIKQ